MASHTALFVVFIYLIDLGSSASGSSDLSKYHLGCMPVLWSYDTIFDDHHSLTTQMCINECTRNSYRYVALIAGNRCMCGKEKPDTTGIQPENACNVWCNGNNRQICGGPANATSPLATYYKVPPRSPWDHELLFCESNNAGCEETCRAISGTYICVCQEGRDWNRRTGRCDIQECTHHYSGVIITRLTNNWQVGSFVTYECKDPKALLSGSAHRFCQIGYVRPIYVGTKPDCLDVCAEYIPMVYDQPIAPVWGLGKEECHDLGYCYNDKVTSCHLTKFEPMVRHSGYAPLQSAIIEELIYYDLPGCAYTCQYMTPGCVGYAMKYLGYDSDNDIHMESCQLLSDVTATSNKEKTAVYRQLNTATQQLYTSKVENDMLEQFFVGCMPMRDDYTKVMYTNQMSVTLCRITCRDQGYSYAALTDGTDCACGSVEPDPMENEDYCATECAGDNSQVCGDDAVMSEGFSHFKMASYYSIPHDTSYIGCYSVDWQHITLKLWSASGSNSDHSRCLKKCGAQGYVYAALQNGGDCYCGNTYGDGSLFAREEWQCDLTCGSGSINCGGVDTKAVYRTRASVSFQASSIPVSISCLFDKDVTATGLTTSVFSRFPNLKSIITKRLMIQTDEVLPLSSVPNPSSLYHMCGELDHVSDVTYTGSDVILRFFLFNMADLSKYVGVDTQRVYLYAHTIIMEKSLDVPHALLIRTSQILIDNRKTFSIGVSVDGANLDVDFNKAVEEGVPGEAIAMRYGFICANALMETKTQENKNQAWRMLNFLANTPWQDPETQSQITAVRMILASRKGVDFSDVHIVPFYTNAHISNILQIYASDITIYSQMLKRLEYEYKKKNNILAYAKEMNNIYTENIVAEARAIFNDALSVVARTKSVYTALKERYDEAYEVIQVAQVVFEKGVEKQSIWNRIEALKMLMFGVASAASGKYMDNTAKMTQGLKDIGGAVKHIDWALGDVTVMIREISAFIETMDKNMKDLANMDVTYEGQEYSYSIEMVTSLFVHIPAWHNVQNAMESILGDARIRKIDGSTAYARAILDLMNWGEALTKGMIEQAESLRDAMLKRSLLDVKLSQQEKTNAVIEAAKTDNLMAEKLFVTMHEQSIVVKLDLNDALVMFCQAYFFELMKPCSDMHGPSFSASLDSMLLKVYQARRDSMLIDSIPSTSGRILKITDTDLDPECNNVERCPVNYFRKNRELPYTVQIGHPELADLHQYRVYEILFEAVGAKSDENGHDYLKVFITAVGDFQGQTNGKVYNFLTRPIRSKFEYNIKSGDIILKADIYAPVQGIVSHVTPYTTWLIKVDDLRSGHIDLSDVTELRLTFRGTTTNM